MPDDLSAAARGKQRPARRSRETAARVRTRASPREASESTPFVAAVSAIGARLQDAVAAGGWFTAEERQALLELADSIAALIGEED